MRVRARVRSGAGREPGPIRGPRKKVTERAGVGTTVVMDAAARQAAEGRATLNPSAGPP